MYQNSVRTSSKITAVGKLKALRQLMHKEKVDAFLVPRGDIFSGEEVPKNEERLKYISNFSGSGQISSLSRKAMNSYLADSIPIFLDNCAPLLELFLL